MKKILVSLLTIISITSAAQDLSKEIDSMRKQLNKDMASYDSVRKTTDSLMNVYTRQKDSAEMARYNEQNTRNLVSFMKERERRQKQAMWRNFGIGGAMLVILIIGLSRKRKKKDTQ